jgi:hypothetical protein
MSRFSRTIARFKSLTIAVGAVIAWSSPSKAFDHGDCYVVFAAANVAKVTQFKIEAGGADFGDHLHLLGSPQGNAAVCWSTDGRAAVKGHVFADDFRGPVSATVKIRFRRSNGSWTTDFVRSANTQGGFPGNTLAYVVSPAGDFRRVRIRLYTTTASGLGVATRRVASKNYYR